MKPNFTDKYRYPRGYVRAESTDVAKTWAAARLRIAQDQAPSGLNVRPLRRKLTAVSG